MSTEVTMLMYCDRFNGVERVNAFISGHIIHGTLSKYPIILIALFI